MVACDLSSRRVVFPNLLHRPTSSVNVFIVMNTFAIWKAKHGSTVVKCRNLSSSSSSTRVYMDVCEQITRLLLHLAAPPGMPSVRAIIIPSISSDVWSQVKLSYVDQHDSDSARYQHSIERTYWCRHKSAGTEATMIFNVIPHITTSRSPSQTAVRKQVVEIDVH